MRELLLLLLINFFSLCKNNKNTKKSNKIIATIVPSSYDRKSVEYIKKIKKNHLALF